MKVKQLILFAAVALTIVACHRDDPDPYEGITRYTVIGKVPSVAANLIATATVYEYNPEDVRIDSNVIADPSSGKEYLFTANDSASHLKIKLVSKEDTYRWGDTVILLKPGNNVDVVISITSPTRFTEPKLEEYQL